MSVPTFTLERVKTTHEFTVSGVPDTRSPRKGSITVRPEKVELIFRDGELRWIGVWGRTILRDGTVSKYREIGFGGCGPDADVIPDWLDNALTAWALKWPGGAENRAVYEPVTADA